MNNCQRPIGTYKFVVQGDTNDHCRYSRYRPLFHDRRPLPDSSSSVLCLSVSAASLCQ